MEQPQPSQARRHHHATVGILCVDLLPLPLSLRLTRDTLQARPRRCLRTRERVNSGALDAQLCHVHDLVRENHPKARKANRHTGVAAISLASTSARARDPIATAVPAGARTAATTVLSQRGPITSCHRCCVTAHRVHRARVIIVVLLIGQVVMQGQWRGAHLRPSGACSPRHAVRGRHCDRRSAPPAAAASCA